MTKYLAALLNLTALAVAGIVIIMLVRPAPAGSMYPEQAPASAGLTSSSAAGEALARLRALERWMEQNEQIEQVKRPATAGLSDALTPLAVGAEAPAPAALVARPSTASFAAPAAPEPVVSLIYLSTDMRKAVVNGDMVGVGDVLSSGARVVSIDADRVIVEMQGRSKTLSVPKAQIVGGVVKTGVQK